MCFQKLVIVLSSLPESIVSVGEKALVYLYKGKLTDHLDSLNCNMFWQKVASSKL